MMDRPGLSHISAKEVSNTGVGIDAGIIEKIFQPFFTTKVRGEGTGMGLALVHCIVKDLHGSLSLGSTPGQGSRFCLYFPECSSETMNLSFQKLDTNKDIKGTILFVDDEKPLTEFAEEVLTQFGFVAVTINDAVEAIEFFLENQDKVDLVIADVTMPKMTGIELAEEILSVCPEMPVVLCTGFAASVPEELVRKSGLRKLVYKPLGITQLIDIVREELHSVEEEQKDYGESSCN